MIPTSADRSYFIRERQLRKSRLLLLIGKQPELNQTRLKAIFSLQTGLRISKIEEYLQELSDAGLIELSDDCWKPVSRE